MINFLIINYDVPVMRKSENLCLDRKILCAELLYIQRQFLRDGFCEYLDLNSFSNLSKVNQNAVIYIIIYDQNGLFSSPEQI